MAIEASTELVKAVALLGAGVIAVPLVRRLGLGSVLGYLVAGVAVGPYGLGLFSDPQAILHFAELGVVMFLFVIGLEMQPARLWALRRRHVLLPPRGLEDDDVLADTVAKIVLLCVATDLLERQHRDRRPVGQGRRGVGF